ncbi:hypothetical protein GQ457_15G016620 [Hibiscus cannabinus]
MEAAPSSKGFPLVVVGGGVSSEKLAWCAEDPKNFPSELAKSNLPHCSQDPTDCNLVPVLPQGEFPVNKTSTGPVVSPSAVELDAGPVVSSIPMVGPEEGMGLDTDHAASPFESNENEELGILPDTESGSLSPPFVNLDDTDELRAVPYEPCSTGIDQVQAVANSHPMVLLDDVMLQESWYSSKAVVLTCSNMEVQVSKNLESKKAR